MNILDQARVIVYRVNKKGLEIFSQKHEDGKHKQLPKGKLA